jgi:UDP-galactopyranose mutase
MNCAWLGDRVVHPRVGEIVRGAQPGYGKRFGVHAHFRYPKKGGIQALPNALAACVSAKIHYGSCASGIDLQKKTLTISGKGSYPWDTLISSLPLPELVGIIKGAPGPVRKAARHLKYNSALCVLLGIKDFKAPGKQWVYFHDPQYSFNRVSFPMNLSGLMAPKGTGSLCAEITYSSSKRVRQKDILNRVKRQLTDAGICNRGDKIVLKKVLKLDYAYVIYDRQHRKKVDLIHRYLKMNNILPVGRFGEWEYLNMDAAILSGKQAADTINRGRGK